MSLSSPVEQGLQCRDASFEMIPRGYGGGSAPTCSGRVELPIEMRPVSVDLFDVHLHEQLKGVTQGGRQHPQQDQRQLTSTRPFIAAPPAPAPAAPAEKNSYDDLVTQQPGLSTLIRDATATATAAASASGNAEENNALVRMVSAVSSPPSQQQQMQQIQQQGSPTMFHSASSQTLLASRSHNDLDRFLDSEVCRTSSLQHLGCRGADKAEPTAGLGTPWAIHLSRFLRRWRGDCAEVREDVFALFTARPLVFLPLLFADTCLRGFSQVYLLSNPVAGLLMLLGLCFSSSPWHALFALLGVVSSNLGGLFAMNGDFSLEIRQGLFGYDGVLIGAAASTFLDPADMRGESSWWKGVLLVAVCGVLCGVLRRALMRLMAPLAIPGFTLVFNFLTMMLLHCARGGAVAIRLAPPGNMLSIAPPAVSTIAYWFDTLVLSTGQLIFADTAAAAILVCAALVWVDLHVGLVAIAGGLSASVFVFVTSGGAAGAAQGSVLSAIRFGLFGYHSCATAIVALTIIKAPSAAHRACSAALGILLAAFLADAISAMTTLPVLTIPFVLASWILCLAQPS